MVSASPFHQRRVRGAVPHTYGTSFRRYPSSRVVWRVWNIEISSFGGQSPSTSLVHSLMVLRRGETVHSGRRAFRIEHSTRYIGVRTAYRRCRACKDRTFRLRACLRLRCGCDGRQGMCLRKPLAAWRASCARRAACASPHQHPQNPKNWSRRYCPSYL